MHNQQAEQTLLGGLLIDNQSWTLVQGLVTSTDFYVPAHQAIFCAINSMADQSLPFDAITVADYLEKHKQLDRVGGLAYLGALANNVPSTNNATAYAGIVREASRRRKVLQVIDRYRESISGASGFAETMAGLQSELEGIHQDDFGTDVTFSDALIQVDQELSELVKMRRKNKPAGAPTGLPAIDRRTGGLYGPRLWVISARPGFGKTALANQVAIHSATKNHKVGICSLEMGVDELVLRALALKLQVNVTALSLADEETLRIAQNKREKVNLELPIFLDTQTFSLGGIISRITEWRRKHNIAFAVVDHLGLVETDRYQNRVEQIGEITRAFKKLTKRLNMPIILTSQLNRRVEQEGRRPRLSDLRDSGNIEQDADIVVFLHEGEQSEGTCKQVEIGILKNRKGRAGWLPERFVFDGPVQTFREISDHVTDNTQVDLC